MIEIRTMTEQEVVLVRRYGLRSRIALAALLPIASIGVVGLIVTSASMIGDGDLVSSAFSALGALAAIGILVLFVLLWRSAASYRRVTMRTPVFHHEGTFEMTGSRAIYFRIGGVPVVFLNRATRRALRVGEHCEVQLIRVHGPALALALHRAA